MESLEGFQLVVSFVVFPLNNLQTWLSILTTVDPATYALDALRCSMLEIAGKNPFTIDIMILLISVIIIGAVGMFSFRRMKAV